MSRPTSTVSGLVSGIDWDSTIRQLLAIERRPATLLENRKRDNETKLSLWGQIQSKVQTLRSVMAGMDRLSEFAVKSASSSDTSLVAVTASGAAATGSHTVEVLQLARAHRVAAQGWADKNATGVGDSGGDLVIQINGNTITIADADLSAASTLEQLRNLINSDPDNTGLVTATILDDGSAANKYRLVLTANNPGTDNEIVVSSNPTNLNFSSTHIDSAELATGWSGTSVITTAGTYVGSTNKTFTFTVAGSGTQTVGTGDITLNWVDSLGNTGSVVIPDAYGGGNLAVAEGVQLSFAAGTLVAGESFNVDVFNPVLTSAADARVRIDGIYMQKSSNTITDVLEGVTLDLLSAQPGTTVDVVISNNTAAVRDKISSFVSAYNSLANDLATFSRYDEKNKTAAPLLGDGFLSEIRSRFSSTIARKLSGLPADTRYDSLALIGIKSGTNGALSIDSAVLGDALANHFDDVVRLFTESFSSGDSKVAFQDAGDLTQAGEYALVVNYNEAGVITSATINGQAAIVDGLLIRGADGTPVEGLVLSFTSPGSGPGSVNTTIRFGKGIAQELASTAGTLLDEDAGAIHFATQSINGTIDSLDRQLEIWNDRLELIEKRLRRQFSQLETLLSQMRNQSNYLSSVLGGR